MHANRVAFNETSFDSLAARPRRLSGIPPGDSSGQVRPSFLISVGLDTMLFLTKSE